MNSKNGRNKNYSVIIVSDATSSSKEFVVSGRFLRQAVFAVGFLLLFFGFIIFHYLTISLDKQKMKWLERDNVVKEQKIARLSATIDGLNQRLKNMEIFKEKIMVATGLKSPLALTEVGNGGPVGEAAPGTPIAAGGTLRTQAIPVVPSNQTGTMVKDATQLEATLKSVEQSVIQNKVRIAATPSIWPVAKKGLITDTFGARVHPFTGKWEMHNGIDIATQLGNKIIAPADGVVILAEYSEFYGNMIVIDHGYGYTSRYGHLSQFLVREGQKVRRTDPIGLVGSTGRSTAPHLHYEVRYFDKPLNPWNYILD